MSEYKVCGYDIDLVHARMLEIAVEVDRICRRNGWTCSLYGGSVLGAIRHNGFIPWDHDIDMCMPRNDYDRFVKYMLDDPNDKIFFSNYCSEKRYPNNWGKVRLKGTVFQEKELISLTELHNEIFIDLHPIDNIVPCFLRFQVRSAVFWSCIGKVKSGIYEGGKLKRAVYRAFSWFPYNVINYMRNASMTVFKHIKTKYVYKVAHPNNGIYPIKRSTFEELIEHSFEQYSFKIPKNYDEFLKKRYGNYMEYPPEAKKTDCCTSILECKL